MPAPRHYRITATGSLGEPTTPSDEFSFGVSFSPGGEPFLTRANLATLANTIYPRFGSLVQAACTTAVRLERVRIASVGADGKVARDVTGAYIQGDSTLAPVVGSDTNWKPLQVSLAVSLLSDFAGPTGRGRFYLPGPGQTVVRSGRMDAASRTAFTTAVTSFLNNLRADMANATTSELVVASGGSASQGIPPALHEVTSARIGDVFDTQRRRRNAMDEAYSTITVGA